MHVQCELDRSQYEAMVNDYIDRTIGMFVGTIAQAGLGLVSVPVNIYSSAESKTSVSFNMLHKKCGTRLKQQYVCPLDDEVVGRDDMVKGYEYARGQYVLFTDEELKALNPEATNAIEITEFVPSEKVDCAS